MSGDTKPDAPRWYSVTNYGAATLCVDEENAREVASDSDRMWPGAGPHTVAQLVDAAPLLAEIERLTKMCGRLEANLRRLADAGIEIDAAKEARNVG